MVAGGFGVSSIGPLASRSLTGFSDRPERISGLAPHGWDRPRHRDYLPSRLRRLRNEVARF
jgi:hypothetical protein